MVTYRCRLLVGCMQASLDKVLALSLSHKWLQLGCRECVDKTRLRDDQQ